MAMTPTIEALKLHATGEACTAVFSEPCAVKATAVRDLDVSKAVQAPVFSHPL